ncbi:asialoglycoprotein receptor 2-like isoform X2 [Biomphalaria glabrata]|uniref:Asialoglycoprotein receptor 2-like isoform X2 n=1 Tax=Biomphalaria glabrata TaxID=6526 RepID=A0A9W3B115_BIOGL|nr:asialoglycoprotein receptor 2-like isoform X2 [Biomphalaria glabrata]
MEKTGKTMNEMHQTTIFHISIFVFLYLHSVGIAVEMRLARFRKVEKSNLVTQYSTITIQARNLFDCARVCQIQNCHCYSFYNQVCSFGRCNLTSNNTLGPSQEIYVSCFESEGFNYITIGSVSACVWMSPIMTDYLTARDDCRAKDAHLYTVKTMEKLTWLQSMYPRKSIWIGLNDIEVEGTYRWEDDNTVCSKSWINQTFRSGEPNNGIFYGPSGEDCINFYYLEPLLNDGFCLSNYTYICEKYFFNFP